MSFTPITRLSRRQQGFKFTIFMCLSDNYLCPCFVRKGVFCVRPKRTKRAILTCFDLF